MDEIADLIRLLAEAPAEEAPMLRPKSLLDRVQIEKVVAEGVQQPGPAVPDAEPKPAAGEPGRPGTFKSPSLSAGPQADPSPKPQSVGAVASPIIATPSSSVPANTKRREEATV